MKSLPVGFQIPDFLGSQDFIPPDKSSSSAARSIGSILARFDTGNGLDSCAAIGHGTLVSARESLSRDLLIRSGRAVPKAAQPFVDALNKYSPRPSGWKG